MSKKKCPFGKCDKCVWWREWRFDNPTSGEHKLELNCSLEMLLTFIPKLVGAIDGLQGGVNEARNRAEETKHTVANYIQASIKSFEKLGEGVLHKRSIRMIKNENNQDQ